MDCFCPVRGGCLSAERLDANDKKVLLIWILAGVIGAGVAYRYFFRAFPEASVEFKVSRAQALDLAKRFAATEGERLGGYQSSIIFDVDDAAKTYLEREVGLEQANRMMADNLHVWFWQARFFRPLQKEEFDVRVDPAGKIVGYDHVLEEAAPGALIDRAAAQAIAESFLRDTLRADLSGYEFLNQEANFAERPNRRDWSFTWERHEVGAKGAPYDLRVTLAGDRVSGYEEFLKVPEAWKIQYARLRSSNNLLEYVALIPYAFLLGSCLFVIFSLERRGLLEWRGGLLLGAFLTALYFIMTMNQWPLDRAGYDTNTPYSTFFLSQAGQAALVSVLSSLLVVLAVVPGEPMYRLSQPAKVRLGAALRLPGLRTKEFFRAGVIGICLAAAHIGYITVFYVVSGKLGAWAPQDLNYTNVVSTSFPWVYPLAIGIYAATSEEFLFRLFAIPFLLRTTRSKFLAVVLPAFAWGFLHSNYPQEPAYIRGIEVGLVGIVAGLVMLRWGILATLTWHYTVDAFLISTSLLRSSGTYLQVSGAIVGGGALIPLAIAGVYYLKRGAFQVDASLLNSARPLAAPLRAQAAGPTESVQATSLFEPPAVSHAETPTSPVYTGLSSRTLGVLIACGALGVVLLAVGKGEAIGDFVRFQVDAGEATARADQVLREHKVDPGTYHHTATVAYTFDGYTNEYLRRKIGIAAANRIYREQVPSAFWAVRYFRDSQNEEYLVVLRPDGSLHSLHHTLDERAPGANLTKQEALARAEAYLRGEKKLDLSAWNLVDTNTEKRPARTDHTFTWEQKAALNPPAGDEGAHIRMQLRVQGDEVTGYRVFIKIPQTWRDNEGRATTPQLAQTFGRAAFLGGVFVTVLVVFLRNLRNPSIAQVPWRRIAKWTVWVLGGTVLVYINRAPQLLAKYPTTWSLLTYYTVLFISLLFVTALYLAAAFLLLGLSWFFLERKFGRALMPGWLGMPGDYYRDALCVGVFGAAALMGLDRLPQLFARWPLLRHTLSANVPGGLDALSPAVSNIADSVWISLIAAGVIGLAAGLIAIYVRPAWMRAGLGVMVAVIATSDVATSGAFLRDAAFRLLVIVVVWLGVTRVVRFNLMGYFLLSAMIVLASGAFELLKQPNVVFRFDGCAVLAFALGLLAWPLLLWRRKASAA
jgi:membrane protease YdiL (CAAX protease family)